MNFFKKLFSGGSKPPTSSNKPQSPPTAVAPAPQPKPAPAKRDTYSTCKDLVAVGSLDVIEPLLEIFRSAGPEKVPEKISFGHEVGETGAPANAMVVKIKGGSERLKALCSPEEFESIVITACDYGSRTSEMQKLLGDLGTPKAVDRLIWDLSQTCWNKIQLGVKSDATIKESLIKIGAGTQAQLLDALKSGASSDPRFTTLLRKDIIEVLAKTGDGKCVPVLQDLMSSDASVAEEARFAIDAIAKRNEGIIVPAGVAFKAKCVKILPKTGDSYVDSCFEIGFEEFDELRDWADMPEARAIVEAGNAGLTEEALRLVEQMVSKYPDFDFPYFWFSVIFRKQERYDDSRRSVQQGLRCAKSKIPLCVSMGDTEWAAGNLADAVKWWIKSIVIQVGTGNVTNYNPFLYLSYVAESLELGHVSLRLRQYVDNLTGGLRLNVESSNKLYKGASSQGTPSMKIAIDSLNGEYLGGV